MACFRVGQVWVAARSDAACVRSRAGLDSMESEAGAATSHHAATAEPESTAAETAAPESTAADEDGATYMGVQQCRFGAFGPAHHQSATRTAAQMGPESDGTTTTRQGNRASTREKRVPRR